MTSRKSPSSDRHRLTVSHAFSRPDVAAVVARSIAQEVGEIDDRRSSATVSVEDRTVTVTVRARDATALRAGAGTWLSLLRVASDVAESGDR